MADTTTLPLTQPRQERVSRSQVIGRMDDDFETGTETRPNLPKEGTIYFNNPLTEVPPEEFSSVSLNPMESLSGPRLDVAGETTHVAEVVWNSLGVMTKDTGGAFLDLGKQVFGLGEAAKPEASKPPTPEEAKKKKEGQEIRSYYNKMEEAINMNTQTQEVSRTKEELRWTEETGIKDNAKDVGLSFGYVIEGLKKHVGIFAAEFAKRIEQKMHLREQEEGPIKSPAKQVNAEDVKFEGAGSSKMNLSFQAGG